LFFREDSRLVRRAALKYHYDSGRADDWARGPVGAPQRRRSSGANTAVSRTHQSLWTVCPRSEPSVIPWGCL